MAVQGLKSGSRGSKHLLLLAIAQDFKIPALILWLWAGVSLKNDGVKNKDARKVLRDFEGELLRLDSTSRPWKEVPFLHVWSFLPEEEAGRLLKTSGLERTWGIALPRSQDCLRQPQKYKKKIQICA